MSGDYIADDEFEVADVESSYEEAEDAELSCEELGLDEPEGEDEFEEITSEEVDRIVAELETLIESVESENIKVHLDEALNEIYYLLYSEEDTPDEEVDPDLCSEAA